MTVKSQIKNYLDSQSVPKQSDLKQLHESIQNLYPKCKLWFLDGVDDENKIVSNPNIGYGFYKIRYANGTTKDFYQIGLSAHSKGISVYFMGLKDKTTLAKLFSDKIGKASITSYCIKFRSLSDIDLDVLLASIKFGMTNSGEAK